eukprot:EG_transcript_20278
MPAFLPVHSQAPPTLRELVWCSSESLCRMPSIQKTTAPYDPADLIDPNWPLDGVDGRPCIISTPPFGPADPTARRLSEGGSSHSSDSSSLSYTHDPYSFSGPTYLLPSPSATRSALAATLSGDPSALGCYVNDSSVAACAMHHHQPHSGPAESPLLLGLLSSPDGPLPAPASPDKDRLRRQALRQASAAARHPDPDLLEGDRCLCANYASPLFSPDCGHPRPWRRLRAKRGFTFYACRDCGAKWRAVTPSRALALDAKRDL